MRARIAGLAVLILLAFSVLCSPASADKPTRGCPPAFRQVTFAALVAELPDEDPSFLPVIDANDDEVLCLRFNPEPAPHPANLVDNVSNSHEVAD
jgi:hypothetical protein